MKANLNRREFLTTASTLAAAASCGSACYSCQAAEASFKTKIHKAMIVAKPSEANLKPLKEAGFEGVETSAIISPEEAAQCRQIADKLGLRIHCVLRGWAEFNSEDPKKVETSLTVTENALKAASGYGADAVLLVPCRIGGMPMPEAWEFDLEFDPKTGVLTRVAAGDNAKYKAYLEAHNRALTTSRAAVNKLIPLAEKLKVVIALENVWNNLWVKPAIFQHFVASFQNPWVKAYFDIGNHVKYAPPEEWIRALGPLLAKVHIKDFKLNPDGHGGKFVHPRDGSVNWPVVRQALDTASYNGWATIEDGGLPLAEFNQRLELIIAGK